MLLVAAEVWPAFYSLMLAMEAGSKYSIADMEAKTISPTSKSLLKVWLVQSRADALVKNLGVLLSKSQAVKK